MTKTKVIVTGGCGFIGSNLTKKLFDLGYDVHVVDDFSTYEGVPLDFPNELVLGPVTNELDENKVTVHKVDIRIGYDVLHKIFEIALALPD